MQEKYKVRKIPKRNTNNIYYMWLKNGTPIEEIKDELRQGVHRPERLDMRGQSIFGGIGFLRYFIGAPEDKYYEPTGSKNPYLMDQDTLHYMTIRKKGYYITLDKSKEKLSDAYDDIQTWDWGAESVFYIPCLKSFDNLDELDEIFINYIVYLKQGYMPDNFWDEDTFYDEAGGLYWMLHHTKPEIWTKLTERYPILLKPEYELSSLMKAYSFYLDYSDSITIEACARLGASKYRYSKELIYNWPTE